MLIAVAVHWPADLRLGSKKKVDEFEEDALSDVLLLSSSYPLLLLTGNEERQEDGQEAVSGYHYNYIKLK